MHRIALIFLPLALPACIVPPAEHIGAARQAYTAGTWTTVALTDGAGAVPCGDGSQAYIGFNPSPTGDSRLVVFANGQGVCWTSSGWGTCLSGSAATTHATSNDYGSQAGGWTEAGKGVLVTGLFDRSDATNPLRDYNWITLPTCTADMLAGDVDRVYSGTTVRHRGRRLFAAALAAFVAEYPSPSAVVVVGFSAGGMGSAYHAADYRAAWPVPDGGSLPMAFISDSGELPRDPYLPVATGGIQQTWVSQWSVVMPSGCTNCAPVNGNAATGFHNFYGFAASSFSPLAFVGSYSDAVVSRTFSGPPGDAHLMCANASPYNAAPYCAYGITTLSPRTVPGSRDFAAYVQSVGGSTYLTNQGASCPTCPGGFGKWSTWHGIATTKNTTAAQGGPVAQGGCAVNAWLGAVLAGSGQTSPCAGNVQ